MATIGVFALVRDEAGHVLCVKQGYGDRLWALPGGRVEPGEDPLVALRREVREETACRVEATALIGAYAAPYKDDLVLFFTTALHERRPWQPTEEIVELGFFPFDALPEPMQPNTRWRLADAAAGRDGLYRIL